MIKYLKLYSVQLALISTIAGAIMAVMPYFNAHIPQTTQGIVMVVCNILVIIGRMIPQVTK